MAIQGGRPVNRQVVPYLMVPDARAALEFYQRAFGAQVIYSAPMPGMPGLFAQFKIGESYLQLTDMPGMDPKGPRSPESLGGTSVVLEMFVEDVDKSFAHAVELGGTPLLPPTDMFFGDRYSWVGDPWGHVWALSTPKETLSADDIQRRAEEFIAAMSKGQ
jgi:PhnB protein